jgi:DivIVA domain-containing protein
MHQHDRGNTTRRRRPALSPDRVRTIAFTRTSLARRGYDIEEVQLFLHRVAEEIAASESEKIRLQAEIVRLRNWYRERGVDVDAPRTPTSSRVNAQAVNMLSEAQLQAEAYISQAEAYSRRLTTEARQHAETILRDAEERAEAAADEAVVAYRHNSGNHYAAELEEMERRLAWLRTFCHAIQVQLRAASDAFTREVDKLGELPERLPQQPQR